MDITDIEGHPLPGHSAAPILNDSGRVVAIADGGLGTDGIFFCGDILLHGPVCTHLEGGSLRDLVTSYRTLMRHFDRFDRLMPGHNEPWLDKDLLPETLAGAEKVLSGQAESQDIVDPWNRQLKGILSGRFQILTRQ